MKIQPKIIAIISFVFALNSCSLNEDAGQAQEEEVVVGFDGVFVQEDRVGKPAINTALILPSRKEAFNVIVTNRIQSAFSNEIKDRIEALSPAYNIATDVNALGLSSTDLANVLANDVLSISLRQPTTFFDGTHVLTGRKLEDDVIDTALLLIFGGEDGTENPQLSKDNVNNNDRAFRNDFPYVPRAW